MSTRPTGIYALPVFAEWGYNPKDYGADEPKRSRAPRHAAPQAAAPAAVSDAVPDGGCWT